MTAKPAEGAEERPSRRFDLATGTIVLISFVAAAITITLGALNKLRCAGPPFDESGRSLIFDQIKLSQVCYSDIQLLWLGRSVDQHVFPYINGSIDPNGFLLGGSLEYPVLTGIIIWLGAIGRDTDAGFLTQSAVIMMPFGLLAAVCLGYLTRWRALWFAATPPLVLYAYLNWELPVVGITALAFLVVEKGPGTLRQRGMLGGVLLGIGACLKLYPIFFALPLTLWILTRGVRPGQKYDWIGAIQTASATVATIVVIYLPFVIIGPEGIRASFAFQGQRNADVSTNSIWYWGLRPIIADENRYNEIMDIVSPVAVLIAFAIAAVAGWVLHRRGAVYPWIGVSAAMLCAFLLLHKVHSPQYTLWLLPFLAMIRIPWGVIVGYLVVDLAMGIGIFRWFGINELGPSPSRDAFSLFLVHVGVWGRAELLVLLFVLFLKYPSVVRTRPAPESQDAHPSVAEPVDDDPQPSTPAAERESATV